MSRRRPPSPPPDIAGFTLRKLLGSGGFADVFLYNQHMPSRPVAVKVMLKDMRGSGARKSFDDEANLMAKVSNHPSIVTIYHADVTVDGRPYLVMEYCPKPNLGMRYKREQIGVAEVLRIGIQVSGAVETAHRAGIIHRDIKPANILVTEYNRPVLTDFGISVALNSDVGEGPEGMSIPWAPPEVVDEGADIGVPADVYSLAATVYTLLAGRSPFEIPGGSNRGADLISRIENSELPSLGRGDVPGSLEKVLAIAMAKDPSRRYSSALAFALALQQIQSELQHAVTAIDVLDDSKNVKHEDDDEGGSTAVRSIVSIDPSGTSGVTDNSVTGRTDILANPRSGWFSSSNPSIHTGPTTPVDELWTTDRPGGAGSGGAALPPGVIGPDGRMVASPVVPDTERPPDQVDDAAPIPIVIPLLEGAEESTGGSYRGGGAVDDTVRPARRPESPVVASPAPRRPSNDLDHAVFGGHGGAFSDTEIGSRKKRRRSLLIGSIIGGSALVVALVVGIFVVKGADDANPPTGFESGSLPPNDLEYVPQLKSLNARTVEGGIEFSWTNPEQEPGDYYLWGYATVTGPVKYEKREESMVVVNPDPSGTTCISVVLRRGEGSALNGMESTPVSKCYSETE